MAGWGGAAGLMNMPGMGAVRPGYGRILTFALNGTATLKTPAFGHKDPPVPAITAKQNPTVVHEGARLFNSTLLLLSRPECGRRFSPDLRYSSKEVLDSLESIVLRGSRASSGMPSYGKILTAEDVKAIRSFIVARAQESAAGSQRQ